MTGTITSATPPSDRSERIRVALTVGLSTVIVITLGVLIFLVATRTEGSGSVVDRVDSAVRGPAQDAVPAEREAAMTQAQQFVLRLNSYGPDDLDENDQLPTYVESVSKVITPKFATSFEESVTLAEQTVAQVGVARSADIFATGVSSIDDDTASVLVAGSYTNSFPGQAPAEGESSDQQQGEDGSEGDAERRVDGDPTPFRYDVTMVKIEGTWLVDDFVPVTAEGTEPGGVPEAPTEPPTEAPPETPAPSAEPDDSGRGQSNGGDGARGDGSGQRGGNDKGSGRRQR